MNIAIDAVAILGSGKNRGIGRYCLDLLRAMLKKDHVNKYFFFNCFKPTTLFHDEEKIASLLTAEYLYMGKNDFLMTDPSYRTILGAIVQGFIRKYDIDAFVISSPFDGTFPAYQKDWFKGCKTAAIVYDIIPYIYKKRYLPDQTMYRFYMERVEMLQWCDHCLAISESVKADLIHYLAFDKEKISCIWGGAADRFRVIPMNTVDRTNIEQKFGIQGKFIMCTGGDDARKNLASLIAAYALIDRDLQEKYQLVIVCRLSPESEEHYKAIAAELNISSRVIFTNFVSDNELVALYNMADLMAFPSQYEGFGLPVVEAFACGTPVLTSNNSSLVEIGGSAAYLVDPFDTHDIANGLRMALTDPDSQKRIELGFKQLDKYQWGTVAERAIQVMCALKQDTKDTVSVDAKPKIAFFTPLPPVQSGISDYSVDIIHQLSESFDIDVFIDRGYRQECALPSNVNVFSQDKFNKRKKYYDIIYQMGASRFHIYMYSYIKRYPGTVVLHDYNLNPVVESQVTSLKVYKKILLEDFSRDFVESYIQGYEKYAEPYKLEINGFITNYAKKIIVHSDDAREKLLAKDISRTVRTIRSYARIEDISAPKAAKESLGFSEDTVLIGAFGHIAETKRIVPLLFAFSKLRRTYKNIRLILAGKMAQMYEDNVQTLIEKESLQGLVTVTGYIDLDAFNRYMDAVDICANLRYPYYGETSGSLMRMLAKGKCALVNNIGSFGEIPDGACVKLPNVERMSRKREIQTIYEAIDYLLEHPEEITRIGENAQKYAQENLDIRLIGKQYTDFIMEQSTCVLTEGILEKIRKEEVEAHRYSDRRIQALARTLAICK